MNNHYDDIDELKVNPESTWIDPGVKTLKQLKDWVLISLGHPLVTVELTDEQLNYCIARATEVYTKYAYLGNDKYLVVDLNCYEHGRGLNLSRYKIAAVKDISFPRDAAFAAGGDLFWGPYAYLGQGNGIYPFFNNGGTTPTMGGWVTWHAVNEFFDLTKRMTGSNPDWTFDKSTQYLKLMPEPGGKGCHRNGRMALLTCQCIPPMEELYGNEYVKRLVLAQAKMLLGTIRKKFASVQLIGGGQLDTTIGDEGREEWNQIMENIIRDESKGQCCYIV